MTDTTDTLSRTRRRNAHAAIDRASPENLAQTAHNVVENLCGVIDAIARQAAAHSHAYIHRHRASMSPPPSNETEKEQMQARRVKALAIQSALSHTQRLLREAMGDKP